MSKNELKEVPNDPVVLDDDTSTPQEPTETKQSTLSELEEKKEQLPEETPSSIQNEAPEVPEKDAENPPKAPPRPVSPVTAMKANLAEAFPGVESRIITGVLIASQGNMDLAFNALLYISDDSLEEPAIPVAPEPISKPRPSIPTASEDDEALARQLQKEFELEERRRRKHARESQRRTLRQQLQQDDDESPDEFEQIKETFNQGLEEARTTLNGWVSGLAKKFDNGNQSNPPKLFGALGGSSAQRKKFDEDPEIISNDFHQKIRLSDNDDKGPELPKRKPQGWNESVPVNSDAFMVTDSEDEDKKDIKL